MKSSVLLKQTWGNLYALCYINLSTIYKSRSASGSESSSNSGSVLSNVINLEFTTVGCVSLFNCLISIPLLPDPGSSGADTGAVTPLGSGSLTGRLIKKEMIKKSGGRG